MADPQRFIAHLDMDAFYASVALLRYPELRGRAVVIGGGSRHLPVEMADAETGKTVRRFSTLRDYAGRGVVMTATYEARARGLNSALGLMKAGAIAPDVILLPTDFDAYRRYSHMFKAAVRTLAPELEDRGIDEIYIDLTGVDCPYRGLQAREPSPDAWQRAREVAQAIKDAVRAATGLSCSIGVAPNKLLAKIASELDKPDGLTMLTAADIPARIWPLPARKVNGIGPKSSARLEALGIGTIGQLAQADPAWLIEHFGDNYGAWLHNVAHGRDERPLVTFSEPKSISRETTFERDLSATRDREQLSRIFTDLCTGVGGDLRRKGYVGKTIGLKLRFDNFKTVTRDQTLDRPTQDAQTIRRIAGECLRRVPLDRRIRLLGVRAGALTPQDELAELSDPVQEEPTGSLFD
jgi:DNA polymerase IV